MSVFSKIGSFFSIRDDEDEFECRDAGKRDGGGGVGDG